jgi:hypothetical protein
MNLMNYDGYHRPHLVWEWLFFNVDGWPPCLSFSTDVWPFWNLEHYHNVPQCSASLQNPICNIALTNCSLSSAISNCDTTLKHGLILMHVRDKWVQIVQARLPMHNSVTTSVEPIWVVRVFLHYVLHFYNFTTEKCNGEGVMFVIQFMICCLAEIIAPWNGKCLNVTKLP